jgi:hypothetical protein
MWGDRSLIFVPRSHMRGARRTGLYFRLFAQHIPSWVSHFFILISMDGSVEGSPEANDVASP